MLQLLRLFLLLLLASWPSFRSLSLVVASSNANDAKEHLKYSLFVEVVSSSSSSLLQLSSSETDTARPASSMFHIIRRFLSPLSQDRYLLLTNKYDNDSSFVSSLRRHVGPRGVFVVAQEDSSSSSSSSDSPLLSRLWVVSSPFSFISPNASSSTSSSHREDVSSLTVNSLLYKFKETEESKIEEKCPNVVHVTSANAMLLRHSRLVNSCRPFLYLSNEYVINSKDIIDMLLEEGFEVYWHMPLRDDSPETEPTELFHINILAVPIEYRIAVSNFAAQISHDLMPFQFGKYYLEQYKATVKLWNESNTFQLPLLQKRSGFIQPDSNNLDKSGLKDDTLQHVSAVKTFVTLRLRNDLFGYKKGLFQFPMHSMNMEPFGASDDKDVQVVYLPLGLTKHALHIYITSHCQVLAFTTHSKGGYNYQDLFHKCSAYVHLLYQHSYLAPVQNRSLPAPEGEGISVQEKDAWMALASRGSHDPDLCTYGVWCGKTDVYQDSIDKWQNPHEGGFPSCEDAKFLIYVLPSNVNKRPLASTVRDIGFMLRFAMCYDRILLVSYQNVVHELGTSLAFLSTLSTCPPLSADTIASAGFAKNGLQVGLYPLKKKRLVWMDRLPSSGHCSSYKMPWTGSFDVLYGYQLGLAGSYVRTDGRGRIVDNTVREVFSEELNKANASLNALFSSTKLVWLSQMVRYILRPTAVLSDLVRLVVQRHLHSFPRRESIPRPFATVILQPSSPLDRFEEKLQYCLHMIASREPLVRSVYLPIDTIAMLPSRPRCREA